MASPPPLLSPRARPIHGLVLGLAEGLDLGDTIHLHPADEPGAVVDSEHRFEQDRHDVLPIGPGEHLSGKRLIYMFTGTRQKPKVTNDIASPPIAPPAKRQVVTLWKAIHTSSKTLRQTCHCLKPREGDRGAVATSHTWEPATINAPQLHLSCPLVVGWCGA